MKELFKDIKKDLLECLTDPYGPHCPQWEKSEKVPAGIVITTHWSRDPSRSNNGGEYYEFSRYAPLEDGRVMHEIRSSYEDASWEHQKTYGLSASSLVSMAELACQRLLAEYAPKLLNVEELRVKIEYALRDAASTDLVAIAGLLGLEAEDSQ
jgi:hypothetical protein